MNKPGQTRRMMLKNVVLGSGAMLTAPILTASATCTQNEQGSLKGNIHHSVARWTFGSTPLDRLCKEVKKIGFSAIDLVGPRDWPVLKQHDIYSSMCYTSGENSLTKGFNDPTQHPRLIKDLIEVFPLMKKEGYKKVICFSGNRDGMDDETGLENCKKGLQKILPAAEKHGITVLMELLNSKVDHKDYMCNHTAWGVELCKRTGSDHFKLLYDIYHMQIEEGDVIRTITNNKDYIDHYHTGGVPGRHEINNSQELYYPAIMKAIVKNGFKGHVAQEFIPTYNDPFSALNEAVHICDV